MKQKTLGQISWEIARHIPAFPYEHLSTLQQAILEQAAKAVIVENERRVMAKRKIERMKDE
jgi:hypothetical protein